MILVIMDKLDYNLDVKLVLGISKILVRMSKV